MKKALLLILLSINVIFNGCKQSNSDTVKIGAAIALTGFGSDFGQSEVNAIELLKEKYANSGKVEFFIEDTQSDVKIGINAINKLIGINKCDIVYCELSSIVDAASGIISKAQVSLLAPVYLKNLNDNPFAIRNLPSADQENSALIDFLVNNEIVHEKVAVLYSNDVFGQTCFESFSSLLPEGSAVCYASAINDSALRETALKTINAKPDIIYLGSMSETLGLLVKYLRQNGYDKEILTTDAFSYNYINSIAGEYAKGVRYVDFQDSEAYQIFRDHYEDCFGIDCVASAMLCYDGLSAIITSKLDGKEVNGSTYEGLTGQIVIKGNEIIYPIQVLTWE